MFPAEAKTFYGGFVASTTQIFEDSDEFTILSIRSQVTDLNDGINIKCGNTNIYNARIEGYDLSLLNYECENQPLIFQKYGTGWADVNITYVPYLTSEFESSASSSVGYNPKTEISSSSDVQIYGSITAGEFIISAFLLIFLLFKMMELVAKGLSGITTNRKLMRYNGGDVPVDKE